MFIFFRFFPAAIAYRAPSVADYKDYKTTRQVRRLQAARPGGLFDQVQKTPGLPYDLTVLCLPALIPRRRFLWWISGLFSKMTKIHRHGLLYASVHTARRRKTI